MPEYCRTLNEADISKHAFELIFAFDEIIALGYRENVTLAQIRTFTEMDSHEENIAKMVQKVHPTRAVAATHRLAEQGAGGQGNCKAQGPRAADRQGHPEARIGVHRLWGEHARQRLRARRLRLQLQPRQDHVHVAAVGRHELRTRRRIRWHCSRPSKVRVNGMRAAALSAPRSGKGMKLGGKSKNVDIVDTLIAETGGSVAQAAAPAATSAVLEAYSNSPAAHRKQAAEARQAVSAAPATAPTEGVHLKVEEKITLEANRDGGLEHMEVRGTMWLVISKPDSDKAQIKIAKDDAKGLLFQVCCLLLPAPRSHRIARRTPTSTRRRSPATRSSRSSRPTSPTRSTRRRPCSSGACRAPTSPPSRSQVRDSQVAIRPLIACSQLLAHGERRVVRRQH